MTPAHTADSGDEPPFNIGPDRKWSVSTRTILVVIAAVVAAVAYMLDQRNTLEKHGEALDRLSAAVKALTAQVAQDHDERIEMRRDLKYLVGGRKGPPPEGAEK